MIGPNLSEWGLKRPSLVVFLMIVAVVAGALSFLRLGRGEDPAITIRTMIVAAAWPGATVEETLKQVTERLERTLQETRHLRPRAQLHDRRADDDLRRPGAVRAAGRDRRTSGTRSARTSATCAARCRRAWSARSSTTTSATRSASSTRSPPTASRSASCATTSRRRARACCRCKDVSKIEVLGAQDEQVFIEFSTEKLAGLRLDYPTILATLQAQNLVRPAGVIQTGQERVFLRVTGAFDNERDIENVNFVAGDRIFRLGDIATVRRGFVDPPQPMFRVNGKPAIGLAIAMRDGGDILALGQERAHRDGRHQREPAARHRARAGRGPGGHRRRRHRRLHDVAVAGDRDHPRLQLREPRRAARHRGGAGDPADARDRVRGDGRRRTSTCTASRSAR